jgi:hypothetical protein
MVGVMDKNQLRAVAYPRMDNISMGGTKIEVRGYTSQKGLQVVNLNDFLRDEKIQYREKGKVYLDKVSESSENEKGQINETLRTYTFYDAELILTDKRVVFVEPSKNDKPDYKQPNATKGWLSSIWASIVDDLDLNPTVANPTVAIICSIPINRLGFTPLYRTNNIKSADLKKAYAEGNFIRSLTFHEYEKMRVEFVCSAKTESLLKKMAGIID